MPYNFFERAKNALLAFTGKAPTNVGVGWYNGSDGIFWTDVNSVPAEKLMQQMKNWVFACIRAISERVGQTNPRLYKIGKSGSWDEIEAHELLDLLHAPSEGMTKVELFELTSAHMELTGSAYWLLMGNENNPNTKPTAIDIISPADIEAVLTADKKSVAAYKIKQPDGLHYEVVAAHRVLHFKFTNPLNKLRGLGATEPAADAIDSDNYSRRFQRNFFKKGAVPNVFITPPAGTNSASQKALKESFEDRYMGADNAGKVGMLPTGAKLDVINQNPRDMEFTELRRVSRDEIFAMYRVPHVILGLGAGENLNRATADTTEYVFAKYTIQPKVDRIIMFINEYLVPLFGDNIILDADSMVPENTELNINKNRAALGGKAWMTVNEVRDEEGLEPVEGGDTIPDNGTNPLDALLGGKGLNKAKKLVKPRHVRAWERRNKRNAELGDSIKSALQEAIKSVEPSKPVTKALTQEDMKGDWEAQWKAMSDVAEGYKDRLKGAMADYAHEMGKRATDWVGAGKALRTKASGSILDPDEELKAILSAVSDIIEELVKEQGGIAGAMVDYDFEYSETVKAAIEERMRLMANKYTDETIALLERELKESADANETTDELKERIKLIEEFSADTRALRVAVTESYWNANTATRMAWKESGRVQTMKWYTSSNEKVCEFCGPLHGKTVSIDENWYNKGDKVEGSDGGTLNVDFADVGNPPLHPNCQCFIRPEEISFT